MELVAVEIFSAWLTNVNNTYLGSDKL